MGYKPPLDFLEFFEQAMDRSVKGFKIPKCEGVVLNLGGGNKEIDGAYNLQYPKWDAEYAKIPHDAEMVSTIYAYHFFEHIKNVVGVLRECQRVLVKGGTLNICVPYYNSNMAHQDLDHKNSFTENTWKILFDNKYYDKNETDWKFKIGFNMICGIKEKNLCLLTQLIKERR